MEYTQTSDFSGLSLTTNNTTTSRSTSCGGSNARKRSTPWLTLRTSPVSRRCLAIVVILVVFTLQISSPVRAASLNKRSADQPEEVCRTNAICGWEVYHPSTRNLQYYVASSCKCSSKEACVRSEDDISISAFVFRCRDSRKKRRPSNAELNETS